MECLPEVINNGIEQVELLGMSFPKDRKGNDTIRDNWLADMDHFAHNFQMPLGDFSTEEFFLYKVNDDVYIQGYIDLIEHCDDSSINIYDWKTSSMYIGEDLKDHARQLLIYAMAKEQEGIKVNSIAWVFLKYVTVTFLGKKRSNSKQKTTIVKHINRRKLVQELEPYIRADMEEQDYDDIEIEMYLFEALEHNSLEYLPLEIRKNYVVDNCVITYELNEDTIRDCQEWIDRMIIRFEGRNPDDADQWEPRSFVKLSKTGREIEDTFFCNQLCSHAKHCPHIEKYREMKRLLADDLESFI